MATSFDTAKVQAAGRATAEEVSTPACIGRSPPCCASPRDTRWGRVDETFGEDPYLIGEMASAIVKGYQAAPKLASRSPRMRFWPAPSISPAIPKRRAAATLPKRTCPTASWNRGSCRRSTRGEGGLRHVHARIRIHRRRAGHLQQVAAVRQAARRLALPGTLITDWDNVGRSVWEQKVKADYVHAAADAVKAGNDLIMTTPKSTKVPSRP